MYKAEVEIYSDASNHAIMKHPGRHYPGSLMQGDTLYILCRELDELCEEIKKGNYDDAAYCANEIRNDLWDRLNHYQSVLIEHGFDVPFKHT